MAAALFSKLDCIVSTLKGWKLTTPVSQQLDKVEGYFNKVENVIVVVRQYTFLPCVSADELMCRSKTTWT